MCEFLISVKLLRIEEDVQWYGEHVPKGFLWESVFIFCVLGISILRKSSSPFPSCSLSPVSCCQLSLKVMEGKEKSKNKHTHTQKKNQWVKAVALLPSVTVGPFGKGWNQALSVGSWVYVLSNLPWLGLCGSFFVLWKLTWDKSRAARAVVFGLIPPWTQTGCAWGGASNSQSVLNVELRFRDGSVLLHAVLTDVTVPCCSGPELPLARDCLV